MRHKTGSCLIICLALFVVPSVLLPADALAENTAAEALAARFSGAAPSAASENRSTAEDAHKSEEAEILERARKEAEVRAAEAQKEALAAEEAQKQAEAAARQRAELQRKAIDEAADAKLLAERQAQQDAETAARISQDAADEAARLARQREVTELSEKLRRVQKSRPEGAMGLGAPPQDVPPPASDPGTAATEHSKLLAPLPIDSVRNATSITVLLVMEPGTKGIRMGSKTADPVLCLDRWCYISSGADVPARLMTRSEALGPINTLSLRAGACRQSLTCVYRGLDVATYFKEGVKPAALQPVDLHYLHHDRRTPMPLSVSNACVTKSGQLQCAKAIKGKGWTAWIVPEEVAEAAGPQALEAALAAGLGGASAANVKAAAVLSLER